MRKYTFYITLTFLLLAGCGRSSFSTENPNLLDTLETLEDKDNELIELGELGDESEQNSSYTGTSSICDSFEPNNNDQYELYRGVFTNMADNCDSLDDDQKDTFLLTLGFGNHLFRQLNLNNNYCRPLARRALRKIHTALKREKRYNNNGDDILLERNKLTLGRVDRIIRKMVKYGCVPGYDQYAFHLPHKTIIYTLGDNFILNESFELIRFNGVQTRLEDGWTIVNSHNLPGWKIENSFDTEQDLECTYLEVQKSGLVAPAPDGHQIAELDSHCTDIHANKRKGDATIAISQSFPIIETGTYALRMKAQKRNGRYGELDLSLYQRKRDHQFHRIDLTDTAEWNDVCMEYDVTDTAKNIKIIIRDGENQDRKTLGILLDDISFMKGSCQ